VVLVQKINQMRPCPKYDQLHTELKEQLNTFDNNSDLLEYLTHHSGKIIDDYYDVYELWDTIFEIQVNSFG